MEVVNTTSTTDPVNMYNYLNTYILNPMVFIIILIILLAYYFFSSNAVSGNLGNTDSGSNVMGIIIVVILAGIIIVNALQYFQLHLWHR